ncbi:alpha/beta fold hydrolase [Enterococcus pallens]|uniref:AB hydrolase-1 domain-containing protein n=1 Tax=Enterococcus pallens ATCC BAA-351 TaxID=1158607 RepID=R2SUJ8_9ENTE|nr:alpha/beta hydrolase [Enterococcus pallens]EOH91769.1 hypothetical protein UAU_03071 [Enterococcus pallens ATCC BAA-351]EOU25197.1 hypothetical protein I588_01185 [Enterococcus pallens ATCC BAA-351]OJG80004.1 hypothetical protein RV10_GL005074 [Enterococcus pallens]
MPFHTFDQITFHYEDDGNTGTPFIFLHGLGGDTQQTMGVLKKTTGLRRISIDFRGHGETIQYGSPEKFSFQQFAADVLALADYLQLEQFIIGGISTGAGVALHLALNNPERVTHLILSRPAWEDRPQEPAIQEAFQQIYTILQDDTILTKKAAYRETRIYQQMDELAHYAGDTLLGQFDYAYTKKTSEKLVRIPKDCPNSDREEWRRISVPTLILASKQDPIHPFNYGVLLSQYIPDSQFVEITPKEVSGKKHNEDSYVAIQHFLLSQGLEISKE